MAIVAAQRASECFGSVKEAEMERTNCWECGEPTHEQCGYCLLPVCRKHGERGTLWFTRKQGIVCLVCVEKLRAMGLWQGKASIPVRADGHTENGFLTKKTRGLPAPLVLDGKPL